MTLWQVIAPIWFDEIDVLGHKCGCDGCNEVARWNVHWPGRDPSLRCTRHMDHAYRIADALGFKLAVTPLNVREVNVPPPDDAAMRFAAMELT